MKKVKFVCIINTEDVTLSYHQIKMGRSLSWSDSIPGLMWFSNDFLEVRNKDILLSFLNAVFNRKESEALIDIDILNPDIDIDIV